MAKIKEKRSAIPADKTVSGFIEILEDVGKLVLQLGSVEILKSESFNDFLAGICWKKTERR